MQTFIAGIKEQQILPNGTPVKLSLLSGWEKLDDIHKLFFSAYFERFPQKNVACMDIGVSPNRLKEWMQDDTFLDIMNSIKDLHKESLSEQHYKDSYENSKIRSQVLRSLDAEGYERKESVTQRNTLVLQGNSMADVLRALSGPQSSQPQMQTQEEKPE